MRAWTTSACVVLAWTLMLAALAAAGLTGSARPAQATTRTTSSTTSTTANSTTSTTTIILTSINNTAVPAAPAALAAPAASAASATPAAPAGPVAAAWPAALAGSGTGPVSRYVVQPGDSLSGIAARFGIQGGWPPLYASNLKAIGWDPGLLHPGTVLVLPGPARARYTVTTGDTLSGIAAGLAVRGGWPALYAANRQVIGSNPDVLQPGTVLRLPRPAAAGHPSTVTPGTHPAPPPAPAPAPAKHHRHPGTGTGAVRGAAGMPGWLKTMLIAVGLLLLVALLTEPVLAALRRRQKAALHAAETATATTAGATATAGPTATAGAAATAATAAPAGALRPGRAARDTASIVLADHDRLVVTCNTADETVYVLRPPGEDPRVILRVARLVLPEGPYWELARQLGVPAVEPADQP